MSRQTIETFVEFVKEKFSTEAEQVAYIKGVLEVLGLREGALR